MLKNGITRDMFLVSCNPEYQQIRHLVITGFAELGRFRGEQKQEQPLSKKLQWIKEASVVAYNKHIKLEPDKIINVLLSMAASSDKKFQYTAYWALTDYILLSEKEMVSDL